jgi:sigma-B regulation protein RsbU (phosphoserine phosphatase)
MDQRSRVILVATPLTASRAHVLHEACEEICRSLPEPRPDLLLIENDDVRESDLAEAVAVVVLDEDDPPLAARRLVSRLAFESTVTMIRLGGRPRSDAVVLAEDTDAATLVAVLRTVVHDHGEIDRLQKELALTARIAEGVQEEIGRVDEELQMAAMVQREFLPRELPDVGGTRLAAMWRPAGYVSGDIYDVLRLDEHHLGLFIADAVGHGVPAALLTMVICRSLPTKEVAADGSYRLVPPGEALARLNRFMVSRQGRTARFATAVYAIYDARNRTARIASAGHPAVMHLSAADGDRRMQEISSTGGLLGIFEEETYEEHRVTLAPGEALVLHSDGFEQAFPHDLASHRQRRLPNERYREVIESLAAHDEPADMIRGVRSLLDGHGGSLHQPDDLTMICLRAAADTSESSLDDEATTATTVNLRAAG